VVSIRCALGFTLLALAFPLPTCGQQGIAVAPLKIGTNRQLFIDDFVVDKMETIGRTIHQATKHPGNPVLVGEKPWEGGRAYLFGSVERNPQTQNLRMWYMSAYTPTVPGQKAALVQCLAESDDGVRWTRPSLGLIPDDTGSKDNNIVFSTATHSGYDEGLTPIRDPNPKDPGRRYRGLFWANWNGYRGTYAAWSPDGLRWTSAQKPAFTNTGDAGSIMYDSIKSRWIFLARPLDNQLSRAVSFSEDFETWTPLQVVFQADQSKREDFYNMTGFCYEGIYLGTVVVFWEEPGRYALEPHLVVSRDGEKWRWLDRRSAFVPHGPRGSWDEFNTQMGSGEPIRVGDRLYFYFSGRTYPHRPYYAQGSPDIIPKQVVKTQSSIGLATLRVDGFVSLEDQGGSGTVTTKPLVLTGSKLHVNAACQYGELRMEVLDRSGRPLPGYAAADCRPVRADAVDIPVRWNEKQVLPATAGQPVRLRFYLKQTKLYSFWVD